MSKTLYELEQGALEEFQTLFFEGEGTTDDDEARDLICEIASRRIPIYTFEILEVAISHLWLVRDIPDFCGFDCKLPPIEYIKTNIYVHLRNKLYDWYYKNKIE